MERKKKREGKVEKYTELDSKSLKKINIMGKT